MSQQSPKIDGLAPPASKTLRIVFQIIIAAALFAAGLGVGSYVTTYEAAQKQKYNRQHPEEMPKRMAERVGHDVGLSPQQQEEITGIFKAHYPKIQQFRQQMYPQMQQEMDSIQLEIKPFLDDQQYAKLDKYFDDMMRSYMGPTTATSASQPGRE